ncbi:hypothetical protein ACIHFE_27330 [Streptomyces sp. NPDC052396]|uniref:hypothetical protein n=1 Tax=Streptomyces sp. NPDC052396 TaxID=3365689 RepID=UPI0037CD9BB0
MPGIEECLLDVMALPGARGAAVLDWVSGLALGTAGDAPDDDREAAAAETAELARLAAEHQAIGARGEFPVEDVIVTTGTDFHVLRFVETGFDSSVLIHLWLDRTHANLALARLRLGHLAAELVLS